MPRLHWVMPALVLAATISVGPDGPLTVQQAILAAADGDTIALLDGVFTGYGNRDIELLGKSLVVRSASGDAVSCILDVQGSLEDPHRAFRIHEGEGLDTVIEYLTITGGRINGWGGGMALEGGYPTVRGCRFVGNVASGDGGGLVARGPAYIVDCWFEANHSSAGGGASAASAWDGSPLFERCTFVANTAVLYGGGHRT